MGRVSVVIPALDEPYLPELLKELGEFHVVVRGDLGLSAAVWNGVQHSSDPIVVVMDGDGSHPAEAIFDMLKLLDDETWLVVGSRYCYGGYSHDALLRVIISRVYCLIARIVLRTSLRDPMSGFWVGYREAFKLEPNRDYKFGLQLIRRNRGHIKEFPIVFSKRQMGASHIKPLQAIRDLLAIFRG